MMVKCLVHTGRSFSLSGFHQLQCKGNVDITSVSLVGSLFVILSMIQCSPEWIFSAHDCGEPITFYEKSLS
jgi:hypothetical protein